MSSGKFVVAKERDAPKQTVTALTFGPASQEQGAASVEGKKYFTKDGKPWIHPPEIIIAGDVNYRCLLLGSLPVEDTKGSKVVKDVIDKLKLVREVKGEKADPLKEVDINVSLRAITVFVAGTKEIVHVHPLHTISYCADDKRSEANNFAYIASAKPKMKEHTCYAYIALGQNTQPHCSTKAEEVTATVGQAFELAYQRFQETQKAQEDFEELKRKLQSDTEMEKFSQQLSDLQRSVSDMEREAIYRRASQESYPKVAAQWESIVAAMEPFATEPTMDPSTLYLVPRPQTQELDSAVAKMEAHISHLKEAFEHPLQIHRLRSERYSGLVLSEPPSGQVPSEPFSGQVLEEIEGRVRSMQMENAGLEETADMPDGYDAATRELVRAKETSRIPRGTVRDVRSTWEDRANNPE